MRVVIILLAVSILCLSATAGAEEKGNKPIPVPKDMSKAIVHSPNPLPVNHCDPNKPQDLEQDCAEDLLHMYQRLEVEAVLDLYEKQMKKGLPLPEDCGCPERTGFAPDTDDPLLKWRNDRCLENCKEVIEKCGLPSKDYNRKTCLTKFFEVKLDHKIHNKLRSPAEAQRQPEEITEDPLHRWRRLQEERIRRADNLDPNDPCSPETNNPMMVARCMYKLLEEKAKWEVTLKELKEHPKVYEDKRISCGCTAEESEPLKKWRQEQCLRLCIKNENNR